MIHDPAPKIGYVVKMFPRLSETFILNEILELERNGTEVVIFSLKKPNEGRFHPQIAGLKARVIYLEDFESQKWPGWLSHQWQTLSLYSRPLWGLVEEMLARGDNGKEVTNVLLSALVAAEAHKLGLQHLHAHFASLPSTIAYFAHRICGVPFSFTAHAKDIFVYTMEEHYLREKLLACSFMVTVTHFNRRFLQERAPEMPREKIKVIHNGIDLNFFTPDDAVKRKQNEILAVGRLVAKKGFDDLLEACALLKHAKVPFSCVIVGDGPDAQALEKQRNSLGLQSEVEFAGPKNLSEVLTLMRSATLFSLPCTVDVDNNQDALPTVLLEALACGLPIISTTVSGIPEIVDSGVDGILIEPDQPQALCDRMAAMLQSPELRSRFALQGRKKAEAKFDLKKNVATLLDEYRTSVRIHREEYPMGTASNRSEVVSDRK